MKEPTESEIIERAYELWKERGRPDHREELLKAEALKQLWEESQKLMTKKANKTANPTSPMVMSAIKTFDM